MVCEVLVSFCNVQTRYSPFALAKVDTGSGKIELADLRKASREMSFSGITGLCQFGDYIVAGLQMNGAGLAIFDRKLALVELRRLAKVRDIHSIAVQGDGLVIVSTGTDQIIAYEMSSGQERVLFSASDAGADTLHVNAVCFHQGRMIVSMFGEEPRHGIRLGRVVEAGSGRVLLDGLRQPHSLVPHGDALLVLESSTGQLIKFNDETCAAPWIQYAGYARGLCVAGGQLVVGRSALRDWSRSRNAAVPRTVSMISPEGFREQANAALFIRGADNKDHCIDLSEACTEIYDVMPFLGDTAVEGLPVAYAEAYRCIRRGTPAAAEAVLAALPRLDGLAGRLVAESRQAAGDPEGAEQVLRGPAGEDAVETENRRLLGQLLRQQGRFEAAAEQLRAACESTPEDASLWAQLGGCLAQADRLEEAEAHLHKAAAVNPRAGGYLAQLSTVLLRQERRDDALQAAGEAVRLSPLDGACHVQKGRALQALGRLAEARACFARAAELEPDVAQFHFLLGEVSRRLGDLPAAASAFGMASQLQPANERFRKAAESARTT